MNDNIHNLLNAYYMLDSRLFYILRIIISKIKSLLPLMGFALWDHAKANVHDMCYNRNGSRDNLVYWLRAKNHVSEYWLRLNPHSILACSCVTLNKVLNLSVWFNGFICEMNTMRTKRCGYTDWAFHCST